MEAVGVNVALVLAQLVSLALLVVLCSGFPFSLYALSRLRQRSLSETARALWAALIVLAPYLGALAFLLVRPGEDREPRP